MVRLVPLSHVEGSGCRQPGPQSESERFAIPSRRLERFSNRVLAINILCGERLIDISLHKTGTFHFALTCPVNAIDKPKAMAYKQSEVVHPASHHQKLQ